MVRRVAGAAVRKAVFWEGEVMQGIPRLTDEQRQRLMDAWGPHISEPYRLRDEIVIDVWPSGGRGAGIPDYSVFASTVEGLTDDMQYTTRYH